MISEARPRAYAAALSDFREARRQASLEAILARLRGKSDALLSFEEVRQKLRARGVTSQGLRDVPLEAIVGSVGRYKDFNRSFLPLNDSADERWARVRVATEELGRFPPVELYRIGDVYFVQDGNHRVSIARQRGDRTIQAYVTEIKSRVPLSPDVSPDELILKEEQADFLERSRVDELRPEVQLEVTEPGRYREILDAIDFQHELMAEGLDEPPPYEAAVAHWVDDHYLPVVRAIREQGILRDFPGRTETDLFLWINHHRQRLERRLGFDPRPETVAAELAARAGTSPERVARRLGERVIEALTPEPLEPEPPTGQWRLERVEPRDDDRLFHDILVPVGGAAGAWRALRQAMTVAERERGQLHGLYVIRGQEQIGGILPDVIKREFEHRLEQAGIAGNLTIDMGEVAPTICARARWVDLVVAHIAHPPATDPRLRLRSGARRMIRRCPRPIMTVPNEPSPLNSALLGYDGSPKSDEALFVGTYLASRWAIPLAIVTVGHDERPAERARAYIHERDLVAEVIHRDGPVAQTLMEEADERGADFIITGGYGQGAMRELVLGSTVDELLRARWGVVLICK